MPRARVRKDNRAWLSSGTELLLGVCLMLIAVIIIYANAGQVATAIVFWLGVALAVHALYRLVRQRITRRRLPAGPLLLLLVCGIAWLAFPATGHAAIAGSVHGGGEVYSPTTPIKGWWDKHGSDDLPPIGCRKARGWTEGTYPSLVLDLGPPPSFSWRKTYIFTVWLKVCWTSKGYLGLNHQFKSVRVYSRSFSEVDDEIIKNPRYDHTETTWETDRPGCARVRVKGLANMEPIPVPGVKEILPIIGQVVIHFWVDFNDVCTNGDIGDVEPDDYPY